MRYLIMCKPIDGAPPWVADLYAVDAICDSDLVSFYDRFGLTALVGMARRVPANI